MSTMEEMLADAQKTEQALLQDHVQIKAAVAAHAEDIERLKAMGAKVPEPDPKIAAALENVDKRFVEHTAQLAEMGKLIQAAREENVGLKARADAWERLAGMPGNTFAGPGGSTEVSLGQKFTESIAAALKDRSTEFRESLNKLNGRSQYNLVNIEANKYLSPGYMGARGGSQAAIQAALQTDATNFFVRPYQIPGWVPQARRRLTIRQLMPSLPLGEANTINYLRKMGFTTATYSSVTSITSSAGVATVTQTAHGYETASRIEITGATGSTTAYNGIWIVTKVDANTYTFVVGGSPASPATGTLLARDMNAFGAATFTAEGDLKPEASYRFESHTAHVEVLAHNTKVTRQALDDLPGLRAEVDGDLLYGLAFQEEKALLYGSNVGAQIEGIMNVVGTQSYNWSDGASTDIMWDAITRASTRVALLNYEPDAVVMHPLDWENIVTVKGNTGYYIYLPTGNAALGNVNADQARVQVVVTPAIKQGTFVLGPWAMTTAIYDREIANVRFTDSNEDDFKRNLLLILAEERLAALWKVPESFVIGAFDHQRVP